MKNKIIIAVLILVAIGAVLGVLTYTGVFDREDVSENKVLVQTDDRGRQYTSRQYSWKPLEYKKQILLIPDTSRISKQTVSVNLHDNVYYDIKVPTETSYFCDYGKTVFADDGSWQIRVLSEATLDNIGQLAGIVDGDSLSSNVIQTKYENKGAKSIATIFDGYAVVCTVYQGDAAYTIMRNSLVENQNPYTVDTPTYSNELNRMESLSYNGSYVAQVKYNKNDISLEQWYFADGNMYISTDLRAFADITDIYLIKLCKESRSSIDSIYQSGGILYATAGDYQLGLITYNSNTTIVMFGKGEESRCNVLSYLISLL